MTLSDWIQPPFTAQQFWGLVILCGVGTWLLRASFIQLAGAFPVPRWLTRALRYVPPSVLAALVVPALVQADTVFTSAWDWTRPAAGMVAVAVAAITRRVILTLVVGMGALWTFMALG
ncbi:AzlD domain-containing protein [Roseospira marina]|uniref:AzlD domain-containing protein n=1 Tax=Roseospira marina TaxID=140057 RepID=A0A5M6IFX1_9PROT|nr:AzlD domain-containing protein [Roseospira marina]KAA5606625.1 AzlD domain-containing protein [Roseospira marina]MBB4313972.1 branched-subunit amino acid transport protein [Roseospira marina]MBB5087134.1 branched-subunit amino acid transport protein [Roseospira marina]